MLSAQKQRAVAYGLVLAAVFVVAVIGRPARGDNGDNVEYRSPPSTADERAAAREGWLRENPPDKKLLWRARAVGE